jgi:hypothetical protein
VNSSAVFLALLSFQLWRFSVKELLATYIAAVAFSKEDYLGATLRNKDIKVNGHERQRCHAPILAHCGYSFREVGQILIMDEQTISRWGGH